MTKPNFFVVGAPKCGTSALCDYLRDHPNVFMSYPKEPHFFAEDLPRLRAVTSADAYLDWFSAAAPAHTAVGEGSVWYLYSTVALEKIRAFNPQAKFIAMLRNPVDLVYSLHSQALISLDEDQPDFRTAWGLQDARRQGSSLPKRCREPAILDYARAGMLGQQVDRLLKVCGADATKLILYDEFRTSTEEVYLDVLDFLSVPRIPRDSYPRVNPNQQHKRAWLAAITQRPPGKLVDMSRRIKRRLGLEGLSVLSGVRALKAVRGES